LALNRQRVVSRISGGAPNPKKVEIEPGPKKKIVRAEPMRSREGDQEESSTRKEDQTLELNVGAGKKQRSDQEFVRQGPNSPELEGRGRLPSWQMRGETGAFFRAGRRSKKKESEGRKS